MSLITNFTVPAGAWNTHVHCFTPDRYPFKPDRSYTPQPAPLPLLVENLFTENVVIVAASIEDGPQGLVGHVQDFSENYPTRKGLGIVTWDPTAHPGLWNLTDCEIDYFHSVGVRGVRIYEGTSDVDFVWEQIQQAANLSKRHKWCITANLPLATWSALGDKILHAPELQGITIIADHHAKALPSLHGTPDFDKVLDLMGAGRLAVKLGSLHRESDRIELMQPIIQSFANRAPAGIVWGSDWPHVNTTNKSLEPGPPIQVDTEAELTLLRDWLTDEQWQMMFVSNPPRLFGL
jgi:predicted TIM-barrel fold metal-dependent hydrolase